MMPSTEMTYVTVLKVMQLLKILRTQKSVPIFHLGPYSRIKSRDPICIIRVKSITFIICIICAKKYNFSRNLTVYSIYSFMINTEEHRPPPKFRAKIAFDPCLNLLEL